MNVHCFRCKHHHSWHETKIPGLLTPVECRSHGCDCKGFITMPKDVEQPNSRLRPVPYPDRKRPLTEQEVRHSDMAARYDGPPDGKVVVGDSPNSRLTGTKPKLDGSEKVSLGPSVYPKEPIYPSGEKYGRGPADVFMDDMKDLKKDRERIANRMNYSAYGDPVKPDQASLNHTSGWQELEDISIEARENIWETCQAPIPNDQIRAQSQQIIRRAMHEGRRPLLDQIADLAFKIAHPPIVVSDEPVPWFNLHPGPDLLTEAIEEMRQVGELVIDGPSEAKFMAALGKLGRVRSSMSEQPTQREPEKPPEPLSKSDGPCPVCNGKTEQFQKSWRAGHDLHECLDCHVLTSRPTSARRDISKAPPSGAGAVGAPEVTAR